MKEIELENQKYLTELTKTHRTLNQKINNLRKRSSRNPEDHRLNSEIFSLSRQIMTMTNRHEQAEKNNSARLDDLKRTNVSKNSNHFRPNSGRNGPAQYLKPKI